MHGSSSPLRSKWFRNSSECSILCNKCSFLGRKCSLTWQLLFPYRSSPANSACSVLSNIYSLLGAKLPFKSQINPWIYPSPSLPLLTAESFSTTWRGSSHEYNGKRSQDIVLGAVWRAQYSTSLYTESSWGRSGRSLSRKRKFLWFYSHYMAQ